MAFATQKHFLRIDFLKDQTTVPAANNQNKSIMKTYKSCTDARAWSMENKIRAKYLWDAVQRISNVEFVPDGCDGRGDNFNTIRIPNKIAAAELNNLSKDQLIQHILELYKNFENIQELFHDTVNKLQNIHAIINENDELQLKLKESNDKLQKLSTENETIKNNTIQYDSDDWNYEFNDPKNSNIENEKELIKLRERLKVLSINIEPEKSTDVKYLQALINDMRKEISILKRFEKQLVDLKILNNNLKDQVHESLSDIHRQSSQIAVVMNERDQLRKQLDKMIDIEDKLKAIIERAKLTDELENERNVLMDKLQKANYELKLMEPNGEALRNDEQKQNYDKIMQELEYYKKKYSDINEKYRESCKLYNELYQTKRQLKCAENAIAKYEEDIQFQIELINHLNHELQKRDNTLLKNEQRFNVMKNLRNEVKELQKQLMETIQDTVVVDNNINIVKNQQHVDEIISVASNTLSFIQDEFSVRNELNENVKRLDSKISDLAKQSSTSLLDSKQNSNISIINDSLILNDEYKIENDFSIQMPEFPNEHDQLNEIEDLNLTINEQHKETLANEITELKNQLARKNEEIIKLNNTIKDLNVKLQNLKEPQNELKKLLNLNETLANEITEIKNKLDLKDKELIELNNVIKDLHSENLALENLKEPLRDEITELKNQLVQKDKEVIVLKNITKQSENDNNIDLDLSLDLEKLQNELKRMADLNDKFFNEITELKELLNQKKNEDIDELKNESNENHELLDNKYIDLENLQNIKINYENEIEKLKLKLIDNDKQLENLTNSLNKRNNEFVELENALKHVQENLEKQQQLLINEKHEWNSQYNDKTNALIQAQQKLTECEDHCDNLESIISENKYKISNLNEQINSLNNEYIFCKTQLDDNKAATDLLKIKLKESQNDLSDVKKTVSVNDLELLDIINVNDKKDNELNLLKATNSNLEKQLQENIIIVSDLTNQIKSIKLNNSNLRTEITELKQQMDELNNIVIDIDKERDHNQELQMELNQFQAKLELLQQESSQKLKSISIKDITTSTTDIIDDSINKFKLQLDEECKRNDELENFNKKLKDEINVMKSQINLNQKNTEIKSKLQLIQASSTQLAKQVHEHGKEKKEIQLKYDQLLAENDILKKRIAEYCTDKNQCLNKIKDLQNEISLLEKNTDNSSRYNSIKNNTIESKLTEKEIADIRKNFATKLSFYVKKIASLDAENKELKMKIDEITADNNENNDTILRTHNYENDNNKPNLLGCQCEQSNNQKLKQLCQIIIDNGIDTLSMAELKFLHKQVYTTGLKKRPDINSKEAIDFKINADEKSVDNQQMLSRINNIERALQREEQSLKNVRNTIRNDNDHKIMNGDNNGADNPVKIPRNNLSNRKNVNASTKLNKMKINNSKQHKTSSRNGGSNVEGDGIRSISINTKYKPFDSNHY